MADFTVTAGNIAPSETSRDTLLAGEAITAGQVIYKKSADQKAWKAQNDGTEAEAQAIGIALNGAAAGQPVAYQKSGALTFGSTFAAAGALVCVSATAGGLCPVADVGSGKRLTIVGVSTSASVLNIDLNVTGVTVG